MLQKFPCSIAPCGRQTETSFGLNHCIGARIDNENIGGNL